MYNILILGKGWGAEAVINGLRDKENISINYLSNEIELESDLIIFEKIRQYKIELVICSGHVRKIPQNILYNYNVVNIHYSLLPKYRGRHSVVWAILNDEDLIGLTIHQVNEHYDDGDILYQYSVVNDFKKTSFDIVTELNKHVENNIYDFVISFFNKRIIPIKQDKNQASWVPKRNNKDCQINFNKHIVEIRSFFRALVKPYPLPFFYFRSEKYSILKTDFQQSNVKSINGVIVNIDDEGLWITCEGGYLKIQELVDSKDNIVLNFSNFQIGYRI